MGIMYNVFDNIIEFCVGLWEFPSCVSMGKVFSYRFSWSAGGSTVVTRILKQ